MEYQLLTWEHLCGIRENAGMCNHVHDMQMRQTDESPWMTSHTSHTKQLHKSITQLN